MTCPRANRGKWHSKRPRIITARRHGICSARTNSSAQPARGRLRQSESAATTTSENGLGSCRVQTDPECDGEVPRNGIPERREDWAGGMPLSVPGAKRRRIRFCCGCLAQLVPQPGAPAVLRPDTPVVSQGKAPLLHQPCCCCHRQIPLPAPALQPPQRCHHAPAITSCRCCRCPQLCCAPGQAFRDLQPRSALTFPSPAPTATEERKQVPSGNQGAEAARPNTPKEMQILHGTGLAHWGSALTAIKQEPQKSERNITVSRSSMERAARLGRVMGNGILQDGEKVLKRRKEVKTALDAHAFHHPRRGRNARATESQLERSCARTGAAKKHLLLILRAERE